ncbi:PKD domain-containing protein [Lewinella sp. 4G2]|uniref:PKD domain-containing protein n=1 Tax=Lewinella sp. 4G2 TaxID=1803372 RepID=UPI0007B47245|nr:PKD domain-containing protein [Lewinella sp. 4G2]OAV46215.1 hypothetical protein A3850_018340 [Lewinella sp. 4G2]
MRKLYTIFFLLLLSVAMAAQEQFPLRDLCAPLGQGVIANVTPEFLVGQPYFAEGPGGLCYQVDQQGNVSFSREATEERCCGFTDTFNITFFDADPAGGVGDPVVVQPVALTIKCPKPDCSLVELDLSPPNPQSDGMQDEDCLVACENSFITYVFTPGENVQYDWSATNGDPSYTDGSNELLVEWGPASTGSLSVDVLDEDGQLLYTRTWCVELNLTPVADFSAPTDVCLDQAVYFTNMTTGPPATYDWDFGDGTTAQNVANPNHTYTTPGPKTVTLYATSENINADGSQGCCCTDSISYVIDVSEDPGPAIYWISTLCEGDESEYWTDAKNCSTYDWSVSGNGTITAGAGTDRITVSWGDGPTGTITLEALGCDDEYCPVPSVAIVPIISDDGPIEGDDSVCPGVTATYELPKWMTTAYSWSISGGGTINGTPTGNIMSVTWGTTPGTYVITATYQSDFLQGLPGHDASDCQGTATFEVTVLGDFTVFASPNPACVDGTTFLSATSNIDPSANLDWEVLGEPSLAGSGSTHSINWPAAGTYTVEVTVDNASDYCRPVQQVTVFVEEQLLPIITGPSEYCVGDSVIFEITNPAPGYNYNWTATNGAIVQGQGGPLATFVFSSPAGASVAVSGQDTNAPFCFSETASASLTSIDFIGSPAITGDPACTNETAMYSLDTPQHPSATYNWFVADAGAGSVVSATDGTSCEIQWNADDVSTSVILEITVCGQTLTLSYAVNLRTADTPVITQTGNLCNGNSTQLSINAAAFPMATWSNGATGSTTTVTTPGNYQVTTTDVNGCTGFANYQVSFSGGPSADATITGDNDICISNTPYPAPPVLSAITDTGVDFLWFCNNAPQGTASPANSSFTHNWTGTAGTFSYYVRIFDANGCFEDSDPVLVYERTCGPNPGCDASGVSRIHDLVATPESPWCDTVNVTATFSADSADRHDFYSLGSDFSILSAGGSVASGSTSIRIRLNEVGCSRVYSTVYDSLITMTTSGPDTVVCGLTEFIDICIPHQAEFSWEEICGEVSFSDRTLTAPALLAGPLTYTWAFGDGATGSGPNPTHTYAMNDTYTVVLIVDDGGCQSRYEETITVDQIATADFTISSSTACAGEVIDFTPAGTGLVYWEWDFGDGTSLVSEMAQKTYDPLVPTTYTVELLTVNINGCRDSLTKTVTVNPLPLEDEIEASNGLIICDGDETELSVDDLPGHTYAWSNGSTDPSIMVSTAGTYAVTVTNSFGCTRAVEGVEVQVVPLPSAGWFGNPYICGIPGSTTLTATASGGENVLWEDLTTGQTSTANSITIAANGAGLHQVQLTVTNPDFGCTSTANFDVTEEPLPDASLALSGTGCEGDDNTISIVNPDPEVNYTWSNGGSGTSTTTTLAGPISVVATHSVTGCSSSSSVVINPLPDVCSVPSGCYEVCRPYTISGPDGPYTYQWFKDGSPFATTQSITVDMEGMYQVYVENTSTLCGTTSGELFLEVINCGDCDELETVATRVSASTTDEGCCYELAYTDLPAGAYLIQVSTADADLAITPGSVNPIFGFSSTTLGGAIQLAIDPGLVTELPTNLAGIMTICPENITESPQVILIEYLDAEGEVICEDEVVTECEPTPDCAYVASDTLICTEDKLVVFSVTVCVPADADFPVSHLQFIDQSPAASALLPSGQNFAPAIAPGTCETLTFPATALPAGEEFCYMLVAHSADPDEDPAALCCSTKEKRCLEIPDCDPCDDLYAELAETGEDCCYDIFLFDDADNFDFDDVVLCLIDPNSGATISAINTPAADLQAVTSTDGRSIKVASTEGAFLPGGSFQLPRVCLDAGTQAENLLEIKWRINGEVVCRDTVSLFCEPDCGYLTPEEVYCEGNVYIWNGILTNTSDVSVSEAYIDFPAALDAYDLEITFPPLAPGASTSISFPIGVPALANDTICVEVILHETTEDGQDFHLNCCKFEACLVMPDCAITDCKCEPLRNDMNQLFTVVQQGSSLTYDFTANADFGSCDEVSWEIRQREPVNRNLGILEGNPAEFTFPEEGLYDIRMRVTRYNNDRDRCDSSVRRRLVRISGEDDGSQDEILQISVYPNPAREQVYLEYGKLATDADDNRLELLNGTSQQVRTFTVGQRVDERDVISLDLRGLKPGVYTLRGTQAGEAWARRIVVQ